MRLNRPTPQNAPEPLEAEWADELRAAVVADLDADLVAETARVAAMSSAAAAASIATAAGIVGGPAIGGNTMTATSATTSATMQAAASATSTLGPKIAALVVAGATVTGGLAATGTLPDAAQQVAADLGARVGIDLPRPDLNGMIEMIDVGTAGTVSIKVDGAGISVADLASVGGFSTVVEQRTESDLIVTFDGEGTSYTLVAGLDAGGKLVTEVTDSAARTVEDIPLPSGSVDVDGSAGAGVVTDPLQLNAELEFGSTIDLEN